jgi:hypothetical protein
MNVQMGMIVVVVDVVVVGDLVDVVELVEDVVDVVEGLELVDDVVVGTEVLDAGALVVVVVIATTVVVLLVVATTVLGGAPGSGHAAPEGRGSQTRSSAARFFRFGRSEVAATTRILRFPGFRPRPFTSTTFAVGAPHTAAPRSGTTTADRGFALTERSRPGRHPSRG